MKKAVVIVIGIGLMIGALFLLKTYFEWIYYSDMPIWLKWMFLK